jgi:hypothetical protein
MTDSSSNPLRVTVLPYTIPKPNEETENSGCILPEEVKAAIPPLHTQDPLPDGELRAYVRLTCEVLGYTWFVLELHEDGDTFSGYWVEPDKEQFGYFSFEDMDNRLPVALDSDASFTPRLLVDAVRAERRTLRLCGERFGLPETDPLAEHRAYYYVARYDRPSPQVFAAIRATLHEERPDVSVYTLQLGGDFYVVVIGDWPGERVHIRILEVLHEGTITILPYELLLQLHARRLAAKQTGGWSEGHRSVGLKRKQK